MILATDDLDDWLARSAYYAPYWEKVWQRAEELKADGCTGVLDLWVWTCMEHDIHFRTHHLLNGQPLSFSQANYIFRQRILQVHTKFNQPLTWIKWFSAWLRWAGVSAFGRSAWNHKQLLRIYPCP